MIAEAKDIIQDLVNQISEQVQPIAIWLFGSAVNGEFGINSDIDLLIIMPDGTNRRKTAQNLYKTLTGIQHPFDLIVATPKEIDQYRDNPGLIYKSVLEQGEQIYAA